MPPHELRRLEPEPGSLSCMVGVQPAGRSSLTWAHCPEHTWPREPVAIALATSSSDGSTDSWLSRGSSQDRRQWQSLVVVRLLRLGTRRSHGSDQIRCSRCCSSSIEYFSEKKTYTVGKKEGKKLHKSLYPFKLGL